MPKQYPRIGSRRSHKPQGLCAICKEPLSNQRVDVQYNEFRGDDDVFKTHKSCTKHVKENDLLIQLGVIEPDEKPLEASIIHVR